MYWFGWKTPCSFSPFGLWKVFSISYLHTLYLLGMGMSVGIEYCLLPIKTCWIKMVRTLDLLFKVVG